MKHHYTNSLNSDSPGSDALRRFILHVVPGSTSSCTSWEWVTLIIKPMYHLFSSCSIDTGTSKIQIKIKIEKMKQSLLWDNFGSVSHPVVHNKNLLKSTYKDKHFTFYPEFVAAVEKLIKTKTTKKHIFGSSEFDHPKGSLSLKELLIKKSDRSSNVIWHLDMIITHKRLHDELPNRWNQMLKCHRDEKRTPTGSHKKWPEEGGIRISPFDEWVAKHNFIQKSDNGWRQRHDR